MSSPDKTSVKLDKAPEKIGARKDIASIVRSQRRRRLDFMNIVNNLTEVEDALFVTLKGDKIKNPDGVKDPVTWHRWLNRLRSALSYHFQNSRLWGIWKFEYDNDEKGVHVHMIFYHGTDMSLAEFKSWLAQKWSIIVNSNWDRLVDVKLCLERHLSYLFSGKKIKREKELVRLFGARHIYGQMFKANIPMQKPIIYSNVDEDQMEKIRVILEREVRDQEKYRPHRQVNERQLRHIRGDFCQHNFLRQEARDEIMDILRESLLPATEKEIQAIIAETGSSGPPLWDIKIRSTFMS